MRMKSHAWVRIAAAALALAICAAPAHAQDDRRDDAGPSHGYAVEVTPFVSLGSIAASRIGAAIRFAWTSTLSLEAEVGYRRGEINALSSTVSLLYDLPAVGRVTPYLAAGAGLAQHGIPIAVPGVGIVTQQGTSFTVNAGGGIRVPVDDNWGYRADARWSNGIGRNAGENWRVYNGVTFGKRKR
jgi:opacity protein-like surface antigen